MIKLTNIDINYKSLDDQVNFKVSLKPIEDIDTSENSLTCTQRSYQKQLEKQNLVPSGKELITNHNKLS